MQLLKKEWDGLGSMKKRAQKQNGKDVVDLADVRELARMVQEAATLLSRIKAGLDSGLIKSAGNKQVLIALIDSSNGNQRKEVELTNLSQATVACNAACEKAEELEKIIQNSLLEIFSNSYQGG